MFEEIEIKRDAKAARNATRLSYLERRVLELETIINKKDMDHDRLVDHLARVSQELAEAKAKLHIQDKVTV